MSKSYFEDAETAYYNDPVIQDNVQPTSTEEHIDSCDAEFYIAMERLAIQGAPKEIREALMEKFDDIIVKMYQLNGQEV